MSLNEVVTALSLDADQVIETSCATIILKKDRAYKFKKDVDFGFLDFSTPQKRREALCRELEYNRVNAPDIYLSVDEKDGESYLVMRRFDTHMVLDEQSKSGADWQPDMAMIRDLGQTVARFHAQAKVCTDRAHIDNLEYVIDSNSRNIALFADQLGEENVKLYEDSIRKAYVVLKSDLHQRFERGFVRRVHGDLHLGNVLIENGHAVLFDCIEFNDRLNHIDIFYDVAFLLMDLWVRGHDHAANQLMNTWLEQAARDEGDVLGVYQSVKLLPLFMSIRAGVRCHVNAHVETQARSDLVGGDLVQARLYLQAAQDFLKPSHASIMAVGGLSGSGKSTHSRRVAPGRGGAPGAIILRSDEIRKRQWRCLELSPLPQNAYEPASSKLVFDEMFSLTQHIVKSGQSVVLDATFRDPDLRLRAKNIAIALDVPFEGIWLNIDLGERLRRAHSRHGDVSDANAEVIKAQEAAKMTLEADWQILE